MKPHTFFKKRKKIIYIKKENRTAKYITYTSLMNKNIFPMLYLQLNLNEMEN